MMWFFHMNLSSRSKFVFWSSLKKFILPCYRTPECCTHYIIFSLYFLFYIISVPFFPSSRSNTVFGIYDKETHIFISLMPGRSGRRGHQRMKCLDNITDAMNVNSGKLEERWWGAGGLVPCRPWGHRVDSI